MYYCLDNKDNIELKTKINNFVNLSHICIQISNNV